MSGPRNTQSKTRWAGFGLAPSASTDVVCPTVDPITHIVSLTPELGVYWAGCDLTGADLGGVVLRSADLTGANLTERAYFSESCPSDTEPSWAMWPNGGTGGYVCDKFVTAWAGWC